LSIVSESLWQVERREEVSGGLLRLTYELFCWRTAYGESTFVIGLQHQRWQDGSLVDGGLEAVGGLGSDPAVAFGVFQRLSQGEAPVHPEHLGEVVRDLMVSISAVRGRRPRAELAKVATD